MSDETEIEETEYEQEEPTFVLTVKAQINIPAFNGGEHATEWLEVPVEAPSLAAARARAKDGGYDATVVDLLVERFRVGSCLPGIRLSHRSVSEDRPNPIRRGMHAASNAMFGA